MGSSTIAGGRLAQFLESARTSGPAAALRTLNLAHLAGRPIEDIFLGLADYVCPEGGTVDEAISRGAFIETIVDLANSGISTLDGLSVDQMQTVLELYATHAIEARLYNDVGVQAIALPGSLRAVGEVQKQLHDFIHRGVADALTAARQDLIALTPDNVFRFVQGVYETAFDILQAMGEAEDDV